MADSHLDEIASSFELKTLPESEVELVGEIPFADIEPLQEKALKHFAEDLELPGFRKGHVPLEMVKKRVGEIAVLEEAVEFFMREFYPSLITKKDVEAIGRPEIRITKLAPGNPVGIIIKTAVYPEIPLPKDWKELATKIPEELLPGVEDKEIDDALESIRRAKAKADAKANPDKNNDTLAAVEVASSAGPVVDAAESTSTAAQEHPVTKIPAEETLPALDDEFAKSLGAFADLADLKSKMKLNLEQEKQQKARDVRRGKIIDSLMDKVQLAVPAVFVDSELEKIVAQMQDDVTRYGMTFDAYLKSINKTEEDVRNELRDQARKRAKLQLVLNKIAAEEKVEASKESVDQEMGHALQHFPDARPDLLRIHIETVMRNEKTLQLLEGRVEPEGAKDAHAGHDHAH